MFPFSSCISILTQRYVVAYKSGMDNIVELSPKARIVQSADTWIEGEAVRQLEATATFPGMKLCVAMPDVHPAKGSPNGAAFLADRLYPSLVGNDDGCGVSLSVTTLLARKAKLNGLGALTSFAALESGGKASVVISLISLYPLVTVGFAVTVLHERLTLAQGVGVGLALAAGRKCPRHATSWPGTRPRRSALSPAPGRTQTPSGNCARPGA